MRKTVITALFSLAVAAALTTAAWAQELVVGGQAVGIQVGTKGVLIAGLTLCITASPQSVNRNCPDHKQLACPPDVTVASLYAAFASVDTPLGKPFLGRIKTIDGDVMIWGPNARDEYVYLYRSRSGRYLHLSSNIFPEWITTPIPAGEKKDEPLDMPELLADLCDCIEDYLKMRNVRPL